MSALVVTITDVEGGEVGEVDIKIQTSRELDLNNPTSAEMKLALLVRALERAALNDECEQQIHPEQSCTRH